MQNNYLNFSVSSSISKDAFTIDNHFLSKINGKVQENLSQINFGPDKLASEMGLSKSQLFRKIKAFANASTSIYMRNVRLEQAKIRLLQKQFTVSEIAYDTGFTSPSYFSKSFKEYTGIAPREFLGNLK
jgi:AraC-like DNA-binding protein